MSASKPMFLNSLLFSFWVQYFTNNHMSPQGAIYLKHLPWHYNDLRYQNNITTRATYYASSVVNMEIKHFVTALPHLHNACLFLHHVIMMVAKLFQSGLARAETLCALFFSGMMMTMMMTTQQKELLPSLHFLLPKVIVLIVKDIRFSKTVVWNMLTLSKDQPFTSLFSVQNISNHIQFHNFN